MICIINENALNLWDLLQVIAVRDKTNTSLEDAAIIRNDRRKFNVYIGLIAS